MCTGQAYVPDESGTSITPSVMHGTHNHGSGHLAVLRLVVVFFFDGLVLLLLWAIANVSIDPSFV
jgi:hypothetical protein